MFTDELYYNALLADAAYLEFDRMFSDSVDSSTEIYGKIPNTALAVKEFEKRGITNAQFQYFRNRYEIIDHIPNTASGFSATLFRDTENNNQPIVAYRGTETASFLDITQDALIQDVFGVFLGFSSLLGQSENSDNAFQRWIDAGYISETKQATVVGHSLGGHLSLMAGAEYDAMVDSVYTFNGAGLNGWDALFNLSDLNGEKVTRVVSEAGYDMTASDVFFFQDGARVDVQINPQPLAGPLGSWFSDASISHHYMYHLVDSLSVMRVLSAIEPLLAMDQLNAILANAHNRDIEKVIHDPDQTHQNGEADLSEPGTGAVSLNTLMSHIADALGGEFTSLRTVNDAQEMYEALGSNDSNFSIWTLADFSDPMATLTQSSSHGATSLRYALLEGSPFAVIPTAEYNSGIFGDSAISDGYQQGAHSDQFWADRLAFYERLMVRNGANLPDLATGTEVGPGARHFRDGYISAQLDANGEPRSDIHLRGWDSVGFDADVVADPGALNPHTVFGRDSNDIGDKAIKGGSATVGDRLYGLAGDDMLWGYAGHDYMEGGRGDDTLFAGQGNDRLRGGDGNDRYIMTAGEGFDFIKDTEGLNQLSIDSNLITSIQQLRQDSNLYRDKHGNRYVLDDDHIHVMFAEGEGDVQIEGADADLSDFNITEQTRTAPETPALVDPFDIGNGYLDTDESERLGAGMQERINAGQGAFNHRSLILKDAPLEWVASDWFEGGYQNDIIDGRNKFQAVLLGADGDDLIHGSSNSDNLYGDRGSDFISGGEGHDMMYGNAIRYHYIDERITENTGLSRESANASDILFGDAGFDQISGGAGDDLIDGGEDQDLLAGGEGADLLQGQTGEDIIFGDASITPRAYLEGDPDAGMPKSHMFASGGFTSRFALLNTSAGQRFNDTLMGNQGSDILYGELGDDVIYGGSGNDFIDGDRNEAYLQQHMDVANFALGAELGGEDILFGGAGDDTIYGHAGADRIEGGVGTDYMDGGAGNDHYVFKRGDSWTNVSGERDYINKSEGWDYLELQGVQFEDISISVRPNKDYYLLSYSDFDGVFIENREAAEGFLLADDYYTFEQLFRNKLDVGAQISNSEEGGFLTGGLKGDVLYSDASQTVFTGGQGDDSLHATGFGNSFVFASGDGSDTIRFSGLDGEQGTLSGNNIELENINADQLTMSFDDAHLIFGLGNGDRIAVDNFDSNETGAFNAIGTLSFVDGSVDYQTLLNQGFELQGDDQANTIQGSDARDNIFGGGGADAIFGGSGDDFLTGGAGDDTLHGQAGNNRYHWSPGEGYDTIYGFSGTADNSRSGTDTLVMADDVTQEQVTLNRFGQDLRVGVAGASDFVMIKGHFNNDNPASLDTIEFANGSSWQASQIADGVNPLATDGDDVVVGSQSDDILDGLAGDDQLFGLAGDDILNGGMGADELKGNAGADTYVFNSGSGPDRVLLSENMQADRLSFGEGLSIEDLQVSQNATDVTLSFETDGAQGDADRVVLEDYLLGEFDDGSYTPDAYHNRIGEIVFADGASLDFAAIHARLNSGSEGDDHLEGLVRSDLIRAGNGDDVITGNRGHDVIYGGGGSDRYHYALGDGEDRYHLQDGPAAKDTFYLHDIAPGQLQLTLTGDNPFAPNDLSIRVAGHSDHLLIHNFTEADGFKPAQIVFDDGEAWNTEAIIANIQTTHVIQGDETDDELLGDTADPVLNHDLNDFIDGGAGNDRLLGGGGDDALYGNWGDDYLWGGAGSDKLKGGPNRDILDGSFGADTYIVGPGDDYTTIQSSDYLGNPTDAQDRLIFEQGISPQNISIARNGDDLSLKDAASGLSVSVKDYFVLGDLVPPFLKSIQFEDGTTWDADYIHANLGQLNDDNNVYFAGNNGEQVFGKGGNDALYGGNGDDMLSGGQGNDLLIGGGGSDQYIFEMGDGKDEIRPDDNNLASAEVLVVKGVVDPSQVQVLQAGTDLYLRLDGTDANQVRVQDFFTGEAQGLTELYFESEDVSWNYDEIAGRATAMTGSSYADVLELTIAGNVNMLAGDDEVFGSPGDDQIRGGDGDDLLYGRDGDDLLVGGPGNDTLFGQDGQDRYQFGYGSDMDWVKREARSEGGQNTLVFDVTVHAPQVSLSRIGNDLQVNLAASDDVFRVSDYFREDGSVTFDAFEFMADGSTWSGQKINQDIPLVAASDFDDVIRAGDNGETLYGLGGDDQLYGGAGNDAFHGGSGNDHFDSRSGVNVIHFGPDSGQDTLYAAARDAGGEDVIELDASVNPDDVYFQRKGIQMIVGIRGSDATLTDQYFFDPWSNWGFTGLAFADGTQWTAEDAQAMAQPYLANQAPSALDDALHMRQADFTLSFSELTGNDSDFEGDALEIIQVDQVYKGGVTLDSDTQTLHFRSEVDQPANSYFRYTVSDGSLVDSAWVEVEFDWSTTQSTTGTADADQLTGGDLDDTLYGLGGDDELRGRQGDDVLVGNGGDDVLIGNRGADTLRGGYGADVLKGGIGRDVLRGGRGSDRLFGGRGRDRLFGGQGADVLRGHRGHDTLRGGRGKDRLFGQNGNDKLFGGKGRDLLVGGNGNDTYRFRAGDGRDRIDNSSLNYSQDHDVLRFQGDISSADLWFERSGQHLDIAVLGGNDRARIRNWYEADAFRLDEVQTNDGSIDTASIEQLTQAMAAFDAPQGGELTLNSSEHEQLATALTASWQAA